MTEDKKGGEPPEAKSQSKDPQVIKIPDPPSGPSKRIVLGLIVVKKDSEQEPPGT